MLRSHYDFAMQSSKNDSHLSGSGDVTSENDLPVHSTGIDLKQALDILSARIPNDHTHRPPSPSLKGMGQVIDMFAPSSNSPHPSSEPRTQDNTTASTAAVNTASPEGQRQRIRDSLKDLPMVALLKTVLTAQEDRVKTYRLYDEALRKVLETNRLTDYPPACVAATAAFAVLSNTVSAVRDEVSDRAESGKDISTLSSVASTVIKSIGDLQGLERQKLQLTAAYHLEQIRLNNLKQPNDGTDGDEDCEVDMSTLSLLIDGKAKLRSQIETCRSEINCIIDDLRCALVELIEMEEEEERYG